MKKFQVAESEIGLMYIQHNFVRPLGTGEYAFWTSSKDLQFKTLNRLDLNPTFADQDVLLERIAEKIDRIQVNGGLDNILTDLINIKK